MPEVAEATTRPSRTASTLTPSSAFSPASITPGSPPPPGLKSSHTVPVTPGPAAACRASAVPAGSFAAGMPISGSPTAVPCPAASRVVYEPPPEAASEPFGRGRAPGYAEDSAKVSWTPTTTALAAPRAGSCSYTSRKMIPAASIEIAIGMKTTSLKAVPQLTRSVSTAKTSPRAVASTGATTTQTAVLRSAVRVLSSLKTEA